MVLRHLCLSIVIVTDCALHDHMFSDFFRSDLGARGPRVRIEEVKNRSNFYLSWRRPTKEWTPDVVDECSYNPRCFPSTTLSDGVLGLVNLGVLMSDSSIRFSVCFDFFLFVLYRRSL